MSGPEERLKGIFHVGSKFSQNLDAWPFMSTQMIRKSQRGLFDPRRNLASIQGRVERQALAWLLGGASRALKAEAECENRCTRFG